MDAQFFYEIIGYVASVLVAVSLMMSSILRLRVINLLGAICFTVYGLLIQAYPVAAVNFFIILVNLYYLHGLLKQTEKFTLLEVQSDDSYLAYFLRFYHAEIQKFIPSFKHQPSENALSFFILRDMVPAGLFIGQRKDDSALLIDLDFVIPGYRDLKIGRYVYQQQAAFLLERGIDTLYSRPGNPTHAKYLRQMGFHPVDQPGEAELYCLSLPAGL